MKSIAVIGAGLRGLASAAYLKSAGYRVRVFEQAPTPGGVWNRVHRMARANSPYWAYSFHPTNVWSSVRPSRDEVLANFGRMIDAENLSGDLITDTTVRSVTKSAAGTWIIDIGGKATEEVDAVLLCPGFLGRQRKPDLEGLQRFSGEVLLAYAFEPACLADKHVTIIGSGASAVDMFVAAVENGCRGATWITHPGTVVRQTGARHYFVSFIKTNPLLYRLTKKKGDRPGVSHPRILASLAAPGMKRVEGRVTRADGDKIHVDGQDPIVTDVLVWCTGWESPVPSWARDFQGDPTFVVAACPACLDTAGFGYGAATAHAKGLDAALRYGLTEQFRSGTSECACERTEVTFSRHIVASLMLYYLRQPRGWLLLARSLLYGLRSNAARWRQLKEPLLYKFFAFLNAPLGF